MNNISILNPVLNSPDDITDDLICRIINNDLESLTINYPFTRHYQLFTEVCYEVPKKDWPAIHSFIEPSKLVISERAQKDRYRLNPLYRANTKKPLKRIEFELKFGSEVHSLSFCFMGFHSLEYVNLKNTSNITNMSSICLPVQQPLIRLSMIGILTVSSKKIKCLEMKSLKTASSIGSKT